MTTNSNLISSQPADAVGYNHCFNCGNTRRSRVLVPGEGMLCRPCRDYLCEVWPTTNPQEAI